MMNSIEEWCFGTKLKTVASAFVVAGTMLGMQSASYAEGKRPIAVVEMFTSQGCSSCPPADKIVADFAKENNVLALSIHVDIWNYLGWKDTFSKTEFSQRQKLYAISFARRGVYTPQAVVNGRTHVIGSHGSEIIKLADKYKSSNRGLYVAINTTVSGDSIQISTDVNTGDATLSIVYFDKEKRVKISRGENAGKTISYHNVVRDITTMGMMKQGKLDITVPLSEIRSHGTDAYAIILQETIASGTPGPIIGATVMDSPNNS